MCSGWLGTGVGDCHPAWASDVLAGVFTGHHGDVHEYNGCACGRPQVEHLRSEYSSGLPVAAGTTQTSKTFAEPVAPGASVSATFKVTSGPAAFNGDLVGNAHVDEPASGAKQSETTAEKVRNVSPVKINEFRISAGSPANSTNSFIELYNAGVRSVDISNWTLTEHPTQQAIFSTVKIPAGTKLAAGGFYLLGLSNSGLAVPARAGDTTIHVRSTAGMTVGDTINIDTGAGAETRKIASIGTPAGTSYDVVATPARRSGDHDSRRLDQRAGHERGRLRGRREDRPRLRRHLPRCRESHGAVRSGHGHRGRQAGHASLLAADAPAGATNIKVTSVANISAGDKIRLDIDSVGHGIETVTVTRVGTQASRTALSADASCRRDQYQSPQRERAFAVGDKLTVGTPRTAKRSPITAVGAVGSDRHRHRLYAGPRPGASQRRGGGGSGHGPRPGRPAAVQPCGQPPLQRPGNGDHLPRRRRPLPTRATSPSSRSAPASRSTAPGQGPRDRRGCA